MARKDSSRWNTLKQLEEPIKCCFLPFAHRMGQGDQSVSGFMVFSEDRLPRAAACLPRADVGAIKTIRPLSFHHPLSDNARGQERSGVFSDVCTHNGSEQLWVPASDSVLVLKSSYRRAKKLLILAHHKQRIMYSN